MLTTFLVKDKVRLSHTVYAMAADIMALRRGWASAATILTYPDSKVYGANIGPIWGRQDPGGPHVGPMNLAIWLVLQ